MRELSVRELRQVVGGDLMDDFDGFGGGVMVGGGAVDYMVDPDGAIEIFAPGTSPDPSDPSITDLPPVTVNAPSGGGTPNVDDLLPQIGAIGGVGLGGAVGLARTLGGLVFMETFAAGSFFGGYVTLAISMFNHPKSDDNRTQAGKYANAFGCYNPYINE